MHYILKLILVQFSSRSYITNISSTRGGTLVVVCDQNSREVRRCSTCLYQLYFWAVNVGTPTSIFVKMISIGLSLFVHPLSLSLSCIHRDEDILITLHLGSVIFIPSLSSSCSSTFFSVGINIILSISATSVPVCIASPGALLVVTSRRGRRRCVNVLLNVSFFQFFSNNKLNRSTLSFLLLFDGVHAMINIIFS